MTIDDYKQIKLKAKDSCKFPFIYKNVTYKACAKKGEESWCATTVNSTNHYQGIWGYCNDFCPKEEGTLKSDEVAVKSWKIRLIAGGRHPLC